jgi:energy-coupling factor transporter ATP-binding protein EcfA2
MAKEKLSVSLIRLRNVLGVESLDIQPGALTVLTGANGTGKTSVLEAIKNIVDGGTDATLVHSGAEAAEVVLLLSDGTEIAKRTPAEGRATLSVTQPGGLGAMKPKSFVESLLDNLAFNPVQFLTAPRDQRVEYLLESAPLSVSRDELQAAVGDSLSVSADQVRGHALSVIERFHTRLYDDRTGVNRLAKEKRATAESLRKSLPDASGPAPDVEDLRARRRALTAEADSDLADIIRSRDTEIDQLRRDTQRQIDELNAAAQERADEIRAAAEEAAESARQQRAPEIAALDVEIGAAAKAAEAAALHENTRGMMEQAEAGAQSREEESRALTGALTRLDELKVKLLQDLPLKNVEIRDGDLYVGGVPWDRVNTAARVRVAIDLAALRASGAKLPLVCVDGLECLDAETFAAFRKLAPAAGLQLIVTRVGEGPLKVQSIPAAA